MSQTASISSAAKSQNRWFYSSASILLLVIVLSGFHLFYLYGQAYPGRPLTPPIRTPIIVHGCVMTLWILLAVLQPLLVSTKNTRLHMKLGIFGVALAVLVVLTGLHVGIVSARVSPPDLRLFGLAPKEFLAVTISSVALFGIFVVIGVWKRLKPEIHRPMMLLATISVIGAAFGRITVLNELYAGTMFELLFSAFFMQVILALVLLSLKCLVSREFDKWFAIGSVVFIASAFITSIGARTQLWDRVATFLLS